MKLAITMILAVALAAPVAAGVCTDTFAELEEVTGRNLLDQDFDGGPALFEAGDELPPGYDGIAWFDSELDMWCWEHPGFAAMAAARIAAIRRTGLIGFRNHLNLTWLLHHGVENVVEATNRRRPPVAAITRR